MLNSALSPKSRKIILLFVAIAVISRLILSLRPEAELASRPYIEDAYYAFNTAYHIAEGHGITADGIHPTNGIQPLIVFLYVPFFAIADGDKWLALRLIFILIALIEAISIVMLALLLKRLSCIDEEDVRWWLRPWIIGPAMWTFLYPLIWHHANGLETGLYALMILVSLYYYAGIRIDEKDENLAKWIILGCLLGVTILARIDAVFLVAGIAATELVRRQLKAIPQMILFAVSAIVVSSPWWLYNFTQFGSFMPISGQAQSHLDGIVLQNLMRSSAVLADILSTFFYLPYYRLPPMLMAMWVVLVVATIWQLAARIKLWKFLPERSRVEMLVPLAIMGALLFVYYNFFFGAPHFLPRYFHPIRILWLLVFCLSLPIIGRSFEASYRERRRMFLVFAIPVALAIIGFNVNRYWVNFDMASYSSLYSAGKWAAKQPEKKIGMWQSGTATFVSPNVINLDGKVNPDATKAITSSDIGVYIKEQQFDYVLDVPEIIRQLNAASTLHRLQYRLVDSVNGVHIYQRTDSL